MPLIDALMTGWQRSFDHSGRTNRGLIVLFCQPSISG
jgi:hypothetical protein